MCPEGEGQGERKPRKPGGFGPLTPVLEELVVQKGYLEDRWSLIEEGIQKRVEKLKSRLRR